MVSAWILAFVLSSTSEAQVTHLSTTTGSAESALTITVPHTTAVAGNRLMLVGISHTKDSAVSTAANAVTYNGVNLIALGTVQTTDWRTRIYSLTAPAEGAANVVVTLSSNVKGAIVSVSTYSGVNQTSPLGAVVASTGDSNDPFVNVVSAVGDLVHDVLTTEPASGTITAETGQTLNVNVNPPADLVLVRNRSSRKAATTTSTRMGYDLQFTKKWSIAGVAIKPGGAATPVISVTGTLAAVNTTYGIASPTPTSFSVSGTNMGAGITVAPPAGFQVSTTLAGTYASSIVVGSAGTIASTPVYVRLAASTNAGNYSGNITLSSSGAVTQTIATAASVVSKATPAITTAPTASSIVFGQTLGSSTLNGGAASTGGTFAFTTPSTAPNAGTSPQGITFTPTDTLNYNSTTGSVNVTVAKATATVFLSNLSATEDGGQKFATATTSPPGLVVSLKYDGSDTAPTLAGSYEVVATILDANYEGSATGTLVILPKPPVFAGYAVSTKMDKVLPIFPVKILVRASDPNGGTVALTRVFATSLQGGTVDLTSTVNYTPPASFVGEDFFDVELTSSTGGVLRATISVTVTGTASALLNPARITVGEGFCDVEFRGIPGRAYAIERSSDLETWSVLATVAAAADGIIKFTDNAPPLPAAYYRLKN